MVATSRCAVEVCTRCRGVWLDAGELELLENVPLPPTAATVKPGARQGWEIPAATDVGGPDPYRAPGQLHALTDGPKRVLGLICKHCEAQVPGEEAYAFEGDVFCVNCRPEGAVAGADATPFFERVEQFLRPFRRRR